MYMHTERHEGFTYKHTNNACIERERERERELHEQHMSNT